ncbi:hypothetical protein Y032_0212g2228 [Ancylostoma ceylanicum]|uniref:Uncharacterized protein n=1 Tax=Ancylostoma ceylanicum TaxID=53326 RepID=A0A016SJT0_9BILA|nr:hypothetical protein Y032_0212g2228 [Ancylostoma ceylanicum]
MPVNRSAPVSPSCITKCCQPVHLRSVADQVCSLTSVTDNCAVNQQVEPHRPVQFPIWGSKSRRAAKAKRAAYLHKRAAVRRDLPNVL